MAGKTLLFQFLIAVNVCVINGYNYAIQAPLRCYDPNGNIGICIDAKQCQSFVGLILHKNLFTSFECKPQVKGSRIICCAYDVVKPVIEFAGINTDNTIADNSFILPKPPRCGRVTFTKRIYGGDEAAKGEIPWLAILEYITSNGRLKSYCAGNVINRKYILTAAHCTTGYRIESIGDLVSVRVGVHKKRSPVLCNYVKCSDGSQRLEVEKIIVHQFYNAPDEYRFHNDIALIRTFTSIFYSELVAPICLPNVLPHMPPLSSDTTFTVAGWGATETETSTNVLHKVEVSYVENDICVPKVAPEQLCAIGFMKDSAKGDSGGGLVRFVNGSWIMEGLVSAGSKHVDGRPGIYTRISSYIPWILANVQP